MNTVLVCKIFRGDAWHFENIQPFSSREHNCFEIRSNQSEIALYFVMTYLLYRQFLSSLLSFAPCHGPLVLQKLPKKSYETSWGILGNRLERSLLL